MKANHAPKPVNGKQLGAEKQKQQAERLRQIQEAAFARGQRMAARQAAQRAGFEAGVASVQGAAEKSKATARQAGKRKPKTK